MRGIKSLTEQEILALAISSEEEDGKIYGNFATALRQSYPKTAALFDEMQAEESGHRQRLIDLHRSRFGDNIPLIRRQDIRGFIRQTPVWLIKALRPETARKCAAVMEAEAQRFYHAAASRVTDASTRKLLGDLAVEEGRHESKAETLQEELITPDVKAAEEETRRRLFVLQIVQPGLAGLMDGSVSTLAPVFAAAFATQSSWDAFLVGMAASVGAGISMGLTEALSDDGELTGRGHPWLRGVICGMMTAIGGIGHTLPYLISDFMLATWVAVAVVAAELIAISWIRHKYMDTPLLGAIFQVVVGGVLVFLTGIFIGSS